MSAPLPRWPWIAALVAMGAATLLSGLLLLLFHSAPPPEGRPARSSDESAGAPRADASRPNLSGAAAFTGVRGRVRTAEGDPVAGAEVLLFESEHAEPPTFKCPSADEDALFSCGCPEAAEAVFAAAGSGALESAPRASARTGADGTFAFALEGGPFDLYVEHQGFWASQESVEQGAEAELELQPKIAVEGTVTDGQDPVAGAEVLAVSLRPVHVFRARADGQGAFRFAALPVGAEAGFAARGGELLPASGSFTTDEPVALELSPPGRITGLVSFHGGPVAGAAVRIADGPSTTSDGAGRFAFPRVTCDPCEVVAEQGRRWAHADVLLDEHHAAFTELELALVADLRVALVDRQTHEPIEGGEVTVGDGGLKYAAAGEQAQETSKGVYLVEHVSVGKLSINAGAPGRASRRLEVSLAASEPVATVEVALEAEQSFTGEVRGADGSPLPDAEVRLASRLSPDSTTTDAEGRFEFHGRGAGAFELRVTHPKHLQAKVAGALPLASPLVVNLRAAALLTVEVLSPDEEALDNAVVFLVEDGPAPAQKVAVSDAAGEAQFESLAPGRYLAHANAAGLAPSDAVAVDCRAGEQSLRLSLKQGLSLSGRVVDEAGRPVEGARIVASTRSTDSMGSSAVSDEAGGFTLSGLEPAVHLLQATHDDYESGADVEARPGPESVLLRLVRQATVSGRVVRGGAPVPLFYVDGAAFDAGDGLFRLSIKAGHHSLALSGAFAPRDLAVDARAGQEVALGDVEVQAELVLEGVVLRGSEPAPGVTMALSSEAESGAAQQDETREDGSFRFGGLGPGSYTLGGSGPTDIVRPTAVSLGSGPAPALRLQAEAAGTIAGTVVDLSGEPVRHAQVRAAGEHSAGSLAISGSDGSFHLEGLEPGRYRLVAIQLGVRSTELVVSVTARAETQATLKLASARRE